MADLTALKMNGILYNKASALCLDNTDITLLTTHGAIEWCLLGNNCSVLTICKCLYDLILCC